MNNDAGAKESATPTDGPNLDAAKKIITPEKIDGSGDQSAVGIGASKKLEEAFKMAQMGLEDKQKTNLGVIGEGPLTSIPGVESSSASSATEPGTNITTEEKKEENAGVVIGGDMKDLGTKLAPGIEFKSDLTQETELIPTPKPEEEKGSSTMNIDGLPVNENALSGIHTPEPINAGGFAQPVTEGQKEAARSEIGIPGLSPDVEEFAKSHIDTKTSNPSVVGSGSGIQSKLESETETPQAKIDSLIGEIREQGPDVKHSTVTNLISTIQGSKQ